MGNNKFEVVFDKEIDLRKGDIEITQQNSTNRLSVLEVKVDGKTATITTTEATEYKAYDVVINTLIPYNNVAVKDYKNTFVAIAADKIKPTAKIEYVSNTITIVTFSEPMDRQSAESFDNYSIVNNVTVMGASLSENGKVLTLRTTEQLEGYFYQISISNVKDLAGNVMNSIQESFKGMAKDTKKPYIIEVKSDNNKNIIITYSEKVTNLTAENTDNYIVDNGLTVISAKLDDTGKVVTLTTPAQKNAYQYTLKTQNIADLSGNVIFPNEARFLGSAGDTTKPQAVVVGISGNEVQVNFSEKVERTSAENISNYVINNSLKVLRATLDGTEKTVTLATSQQIDGKLYTVTISAVTDLAGNTINTYDGMFGGMDVASTELTYNAKAVGDTLVLSFNKKLDKQLAENVLNYKMDNELEYPSSATLDYAATGKIVTLQTGGFISGKLYNITVKNVTDLAGNKISTDDNICSKFFTSSGSNTLSAKRLQAAIIVNVNTIDLVFNSDLSAGDIRDMRVTIPTQNGDTYTAPPGLTTYKYTYGNDSVVRVQFKTTESNNPSLFDSGDIYKAQVTGIDNLITADGANIVAFAGTSKENDLPAVDEITAINKTAVKIKFTEPVKGIEKTLFSITGINITNISVDSYTDVTDNVILYLNASSPLKENTIYKLYIKNGVRDAAGLNDLELSESNTYYAFTGTAVANEAPTVEAVNVIDKYNMEVTFSEPLAALSSGSFSIKKLSGSGGTTVLIANTQLADDKITAKLFLNYQNDALNSNGSYQLSVSSSVKDLQGMSVDTASRKMDFFGSDTDIEKLEIVASSIDEDNEVITMVMSRELNMSSISMDYFTLTGADYYKNSKDEIEFEGNIIRIKLYNALTSANTLTIKVTTSGKSAIKDFNNQKITTEKVDLDI